YVYVVDKDNKAQYRPLKVGRLLGKYRVIDEGLSADDRVVAVGLQRVVPGAVVAPTEIKFED
ncbi:MAG: efflux transporter periplasmic adaptor subunit, partial [Opitutales bacterium]|nr:efflux transporter periplasmic adaptor subunit [Opitutales bacterium]